MQRMGDHHKPGELHLMLETNPPPSFTTRIPRVPEMLKERGPFNFSPRRISLGPYHHRLPWFYNDVKFRFRDRLVSYDSKKLEILYNKLLGMVKELRGYYDEDDETLEISDDEFTKMMVLDGCFLLSFIKDTVCDYESRSHVHYNYLLEDGFLGDIFLLENQIPYQVLNEVMKLLPDDMLELNINRFINTTQFLLMGEPKESENDRIILDSTNHFLELLQTRITEKKGWSIQVGDLLASSCKVRELTKTPGLRFRPNRSGSLACISYVKNWFFSTYLELPPVTLKEYTTECLLLNLVAQEMCFGAPWITMYLYLLDSLIDHYEDVTILRNAGVLNSLLRSDQDVVDWFHDIRRYLKPCPLVKSVIHINHYDSQGSLKVKHE